MASSSIAPTKLLVDPRAMQLRDLKRAQAMIELVTKICSDEGFEVAALAGAVPAGLGPGDIVGEMALLTREPQRRSGSSLRRSWRPWSRWAMA